MRWKVCKWPSTSCEEIALRTVDPSLISMVVRAISTFAPIPLAAVKPGGQKFGAGPSGISDQYSGCENQSAAQNNLECGPEKRRFHVAVLNPGDGP